MTSSETESQQFRTKALIALGVAVIVAVGAWMGLNAATERATARLAAIDRARSICSLSWDSARTRAETLMVDRIPLRDTIDAKSEDALTRCGSLRSAGIDGATPKPREMSGEPMPKGLR